MTTSLADFEKRQKQKCEDSVDFIKSVTRGHLETELLSIADVLHKNRSNGSPGQMSIEALDATIYRCTCLINRMVFEVSFICMLIEWHRYCALL